MLKAKELRDESVDELEAKQKTLRQEIFDLRGDSLDGRSQKTHLIRQKRKEIARILTVLGEKNDS